MSPVFRGLLLYVRCMQTTSVMFSAEASRAFANTHFHPTFFSFSQATEEDLVAGRRMNLASILYQLACPDSIVADKATLRAEMIEGITRDSESICNSLRARI